MGTGDESEGNKPIWLWWRMHIYWPCRKQTSTHTFFYYTCILRTDCWLQERKLVPRLYRCLWEQKRLTVQDLHEFSITGASGTTSNVWSQGRTQKQLKWRGLKGSVDFWPTWQQNRQTRTKACCLACLNKNRYLGTKSWVLGLSDSRIGAKRKKKA